jgi:glycosyltransferase involved in cell wall biosynthesis
MKITLAHDSFTQQGGAERVAFAFHEMYPEAPFLTIVVDAKMKSLVSGWDIKTSALQPLYDMHPKFQHWLALIPWAVDNLAVPSCDVLLSSSSFFIKGLRKPAGSIHINYCHTPTRFLWIDSEYVKQEVPAAIRPFVRWFLKMLRKGDLRAAKNVDYFIANSKEVQRRIKEIYKKDSEIIYPFIDEYFWKPTKPKGDYFLVAGRLQPHKGNEHFRERALKALRSLRFLTPVSSQKDRG